VDAGDRPADQRPAQPADSGFNFGEFGHYLVTPSLSRPIYCIIEPMTVVQRGERTIESYAHH
jgi:hypothetical protein